MVTIRFTVRGSEGSVTVPVEQEETMRAMLVLQRATVVE